VLLGFGKADLPIENLGWIEGESLKLSHAVRLIRTSHYHYQLSFARIVADL
jgi:hypothetical protein